MTIGQTVGVKHPIRLLFVPLLGLAVVAAGCGDDKKDSAASSTTAKAAKTTTTAEGSATSAAGAPAVPAECADAGGAAAEIAKRGKPTVSVPTDSKPVDNVVGKGDTVIDKGSVKIQYVIAKPDGTELESSWTTGSAQNVPLTETFPGFGTAMKGMKVGGQRTFVVPATEVFGEQLPTGVTAGDSVVFVVDLVSVSKDAGSTSAAPDDKALAAAKKRGAPDVTAPKPLPTGLTVIDEVTGDGAVVCPGATVVAHYTGVGANTGKTFDSSWKNGDPATFSLDGVIKGWTDGLVGMKVGGRRTLVIPADQAYGATPPQGSSIEANEPLVFTIDLVGVG